MESLREARARRMHTVRSLAAAAGCTPKTITDIELGRITPTFGTMRKIGTALGVEPTEVAEFAAAIEARGKAAA
jgi:transcriptional regulator with XRE-family HTH domain